MTARSGADMRLILPALMLAAALTGAPARADDPAPVSDAAGGYAALQQVELTEDEVARYVGSFEDMQKAMGDVPADAPEPDAKTMAKLEQVAVKHGFRSFDEYNNVAGSISLVVDGIDPDTKTYVGQEKLIQKAIEGVNADSKMTPADKATATQDLEAQLKAVMPVKYKGNIDLVLKHYDQINGG
jgi:hypothetical protein